MKSKELIKGCGKNIDWEVFGDTPIGEYVCGEDGELCLICKAKQSERLNCYKEELEFLEVKMFDFMNINGTCFRIMSDRINFLKQEIKILDTLKGIKEKG